MPIDASENPYGDVQIEQDESTIIMTPQGAVNYQTWLTSTPSASASTQVASSTTVGALARDRDGSPESNSDTPRGQTLTRSSSWLHTPRPMSSLPRSGAQSVNTSSSHNRSISPGQAEEIAQQGRSQGKKKKENKKKNPGDKRRDGRSAGQQTKGNSKRKRAQSDDVEQGSSGGAVQQRGTGVQTADHGIRGSDAPTDMTLPPYMKLKSTLPEEEMDEGRLSAPERTKRSKLRMNARNELHHYFYQRTENLLPDSEETLKEYTPEALLACLSSLLREKRGCDGYQESINISADNRGSRPAKPAYEPYHFETVVYWPYFMTQEKYKKAIKTRTPRRLSEDDDEEESDENNGEGEDPGADDESDEGEGDGDK